ncbi:MAG: dihydrofolate reductase family protein, partial [Halobacteriota archaeon]
MRPFVIINSAMSADGKISTVARKQVRISGKEDMQRVDALKANTDAVMVGIGTVLADDPKLTIKSDILKRERVAKGRTKNPLRIVVDSNARTPSTAAI